MLKRIHSNKIDISNEIDEDLFIHTFNSLDDVVNEVFNDKKMTKKDRVFVDELRYNNAVFSAFKTHRQQNDLAGMLTDSDGNVRSFNQFREATKVIIGDYNVNWLRTEYNTALKTARTAKQFRQYQNDSDLFPNLKWLPSRAANPREAHKPYYNMVRSINDPFWKTTYPGCVWGCKCGITNTDEEATAGSLPSGDPSNPVTVPGLDANPAFTGSLFSDSHPYRTESYKGASKAANRKAKEFINKEKK